MQSFSPQSTDPAGSPARMRAAISSGSRPIGQARTQLEQRMHGPGLLASTSLPVSASTPPLPFTSGTSRLDNCVPIIGPPSTRRAASARRPPQARTTSAASVPTSTSRLPGAVIAPPLTVTMREISGRPRRRACCTA